MRAGSAGQTRGRRPSVDQVAHIIGRAIFGGYFIYSGINHFTKHQAMSGYARSKGVPMPGLAVAVTGVMLVAGGASFLTGTKPRLGASLLTAFLLPVSSKMHDFWNVTDAMARQHELVNFTKNIALAGATALVMAVPEPWPLSLRPSHDTSLEQGGAERRHAS